MVFFSSISLNPLRIHVNPRKIVFVGAPQTCTGSGVWGFEGLGAFKLGILNLQYVFWGLPLCDLAFQGFELVLSFVLCFVSSDFGRIPSHNSRKLEPQP